jgi:hypothetical protein
MKNAKVWLKKAIAEEDARKGSPRGERRRTPRLPELRELLTAARDESCGVCARPTDWAHPGYTRPVGLRLAPPSMSHPPLRELSNTSGDRARACTSVRPRLYALVSVATDHHRA